jgi:hypothetical protein
VSAYFDVKVIRPTGSSFPEFPWCEAIDGLAYEYREEVLRRTEKGSGTRRRCLLLWRDAAGYDHVAYTDDD